MMRLERLTLCVLVLVLGASACRVPPDGFRCSAHAACTHDGQPGFCEATGACSTTDATCPSGRRYLPDSTGGLGSSCVSSELDGGIPGDDAGTSIAPIIARGATVVLPGTGRSSIDVTIPPGTQAGDYVLVVFTAGPYTLVPTVPTTWKKRAERVECEHEGNTYWYSFVQGVGDPLVYNVGFPDVANHSTAVTLSYGNVTTTSMPRSESLSEDCLATMGQVAQTNSIFGQVGDRLIAIFTADTTDGETWSTPNGMTPVASTGLIAVFDEYLEESGMTGPRASSVYGHSNGPRGGYYAATLPHL